MKSLSAPIPGFAALAALLTALLGAAPLAAQTPSLEIAERLDPIIIAPPDPFPCPALRAGDITREQPFHEVKLFFPWWPGIDESTIGDGDLVAKGPNDYLQKARFVSLERLPIPFPQPLTTVAEGADDILNVPQPHPIAVATYRFFPPPRASGIGDRNTWTARDNGRYVVGLAEGEIGTDDGGFFPPKRLGGFRCIIQVDPPVTIQPSHVRCAVKRHRLAATEVRPDATTAERVGYHALVSMYFRTPHVRIDWGSVVRDGTTFKVNATAVRLPIPGPDPEPVPLPLAGKFPPESINGEVVIDPDPTRPDILPCFRHRYDLGSPAPGEYRFVLSVNGVLECTDTFRVPPIPPIDDDPPGAELAVRNITQASNRPQRMVVTYKDRSGVALSSIGDGDLVVYSPCLFLDSLADSPCNWGAQRARLVEILSVSDDRQIIKALYEIDAPRGGWTHHQNGFYPVVLWEDAVCDRLGNCTERERLGGFEVAIDPTHPPVPAEADLRVDPSNPNRVKAKVHIDFKDYFKVTGQTIRRDGNRIYLIATAAPYLVPGIFPPPPLPEEDLVYDIGPLRDGDYAAIFVMNGHVYDAEKFVVKREPPIPADVDLAINASDPDNVFATVTIQFRTPHRVEQGEVRRDGHRLFLPAKAEPLPILLGDDAVKVDGTIDPGILPPIIEPPRPVVLTYKIGALPPGGYLGVFVMNDFPYAAEDFKIDDPGPPIDAEVALRVNQEDPANTTVVATIKFRHPHIITERDIHRRGNHFLLEATAIPINILGTVDANGFAPVPVPQIVTIEYPLGDLEAGQYAATFVMNGWRYANTDWIERGNPFDAEVAIDVEQSDSGSWTAHVKVLFSNPRVRITDPGTPVSNGAIIMINAKAALLEVDPDDPGEDPTSRVIELHYDLGLLRPGGHWLKFFINDHFEKQHDFVVPPAPPIPAKVELKVDSSHDPVLATAIVQFRDHYRITEQSVSRFGNVFILDATADGPLPILAPLPPPPIELLYDLGSPRPGFYFAAYRMNGYFYEVIPFRIADPGFEAKVDLSIAVDDNDAKLTAVVDFEDPYVVVTNPGRPVISGNTIKINATAERVVFVQEPSGDPVTLCYELENLAPGHYTVEYCLNGNPEAHLRFEIERPCESPANVSHIRIAQGNASWFAQVGVILAPGQVVTDWGVVRQSGNEFHVNITVECVDFPIDPAPLPDPFEPLPLDPNDLPDGVNIDASGTLRIGGFPVRIVTHDYVLGVLDQGHYAFCVHSLGQTVACKRFEVSGAPPQVEVSVANITSASDEHRFGISYHDPTGLDHESIMNAEVWIVSNTGYRERAELLSYASTDDDPSSSASARYAVHGPGGSWDSPDNGKYRIVVDPAAIRDLQGNHLENGRIGRFYVRILPDPPNPGVNVSVAPNATGEWEATVEIISEPGQQVVINNWEFLCLEFGQTIIKLADAEIEPTNGPVEPLAHVYNLGALQPGYYVFVFKTDLAHCGNAGFTVPGLEGDPVDNWQLRAGIAAQSDEEDRDNDGLNVVGEYFFVTDPEVADAPDVRGEIVTSQDGTRHFGLRLRHLHGAEGVTRIIEGSTDLNRWVDVTDRIDVIEQTVNLDGTVEVLLCLRDTLADGPYHFLRVAAVRDRN